MSNTHRYIRFFKDIGIGDVPRVGGKNASLGEMYQALSAQGVPVPEDRVGVYDLKRRYRPAVRATLT